jgi:hypothetical protein
MEFFKVQCQYCGNILESKEELRIHETFHGILEFGQVMDRECGGCGYYSSLGNFKLFRSHLDDEHIDMKYKHEKVF